MTFDTQSAVRENRRSFGAGPQDAVLFYAEQPLGVALAAQALPLFLFLPFLLPSPEAIPVVLLTAALFALLHRRVFRFELTARRLRFRPALFASTLDVALAEVRAAEALDMQGRPPTMGKRPAIGHLRLTLADGRQALVAGIRDPNEAADAVRTLQRGEAGDA